MTLEQWADAVTLTAIGVATLALIADAIWRLWRRWQARDRDSDPVIAGLISEKGARPKHAGFDPKIREQARRKRERAERAQARANKIASTPVQAPKPKTAPNVTPIKWRA